MEKAKRDRLLAAYLSEVVDGLKTGRSNLSWDAEAAESKGDSIRAEHCRMYIEAYALAAQLVEAGLVREGITLPDVEELTRLLGECS